MMLKTYSFLWGFSNALVYSSMSEAKTLLVGSIFVGSEGMNKGSLRNLRVGQTTECANFREGTVKSGPMTSSTETGSPASAVSPKLRVSSPLPLLQVTSTPSSHTRSTGRLCLMASNSSRKMNGAVVCGYSFLGSTTTIHLSDT